MRLLPPLIIGLVMVLGPGCAGYRLGPTNGATAGNRSIEVTPFSNQTMEPRLGDDVTIALRHQLQRDGTYRLSSGGSPNILITGVLTRYDRHELSFVPHDVLTVSDFRVSVRAQVTARDLTSGKTILDKEVTGYTLVRVGSDLTSAERQAMPLLAENLAQNITALLVDGTW